jgi:hypothetical protein
MVQPNAAALIELTPMRGRQWLAIAVTVLLNAFDGFDVLSSAFAGPGIKAEWDLGPDGARLGAAGRGRRPVWAAPGNFDVPGADGCRHVWRGDFEFGADPVGVARADGPGLWGNAGGGQCADARIVEYLAVHFVMALMVIGYPLGAFVLGGGMPLALIQAFILFVPETPVWLIRARSRDALARINRSLIALSYPPVGTLPQAPTGAPPRAGVRALFTPEHRRVTLLVVFAYAAHAMAFHFVLKMAPVILSDPQFAGLHFKRGASARALVFANLGGAIGGDTFGWLMHRYTTRRATLAALALSFVMVTSFGLGQPSLMAWTVAIALIACVTNAAIVGFYAVFASLYPPELKATGTGFALAVGRAGAALAPIASAAMFAHHLPLGWVAGIMASGSLIALLLFIGLPTGRTDGHAIETAAL